MSLRLAFMGTADFAVPSLAALLDAGHDVLAVYSQPARPKGRGHKPQPSPVAALAARREIETRTPERLGAEEVAAFAALRLDAAIVAAYGLLLPQAVLDVPRLGCVNVHASLLPRWRGAAPIERAILAGDSESGVTIMRMDAGLDTGPILAAEAIAIGPRATATELYDTLSRRGAALLIETLKRLSRDTITARIQPENDTIYAKKIHRSEGVIDWRRPAVYIDRQVRALNPRVPTWFSHGGERIKLLEAEPAGGGGIPGTVLDGAPTVACGEGALRLLRLQRENRGALGAAEFLRGHALPPGTMLPCPDIS